MRTLLAGAAATFIAFAQIAPSPAPKPVEPRIQLAILLDTSSSMDGLIDQARGELWKIVNEMAKAKKEGMRARLEVALYEYGNSGLSQESGYVRRVSPFTIDLDKISEELFALHTNGGDEWCGRVLADADRELDWTGGDGDLRIAFVAGNEPFNQGPVAFQESIAKLKKKGVRVGTIFCGSGDSSDAITWRDAAALGGGGFVCIDQAHRTVYRAAPQDAELAKLGIAINETYVYYGTDGHASWQRQSQQDANALSMGAGSFVNRAAVKGSSNYSNARWDLVDAIKEGRVKASAVPVDELPEALRKLSAAERDAFVTKQAARRAELTRQIAQLNAARELFLATADKSKALGGKTLDSALVDSLKSLARERGWALE